MYCAGNGTASPAPPRSYPEQIRPRILFLFDNFVIVIEDASCELSYEMKTFIMLTRYVDKFRLSEVDEKSERYHELHSVSENSSLSGSIEAIEFLTTKRHQVHEQYFSGKASMRCSTK